MGNSVAFIGLGKMGLPMARHIERNGHEIVGFDTSRERITGAREAGLMVAPRPEDILRSSGILISSLPNDAALLNVSELICDCAVGGSIYIDTSTVSVEASATVAEQMKRAGITYLRCTVSGNNLMAEAAKLTVMVSGDPTAFQTCKHLFRCWGEVCFYLGDAEQAKLMKLSINLMINLTSGMLAEALSLGQKGGLTWSDMWPVIEASAVGSPIVKAKAGALAKRDFTATFTVEQMRKDVGLVLDAGKSLNVPLGLTALAAQWLSSASACGYGNEDYAAIIKVVETASGIGLN
ncbi:NAD(P)-dependent oxidoreductase [Paraburkholderia strydomiana]|uniref:NAD(P)-dependent oxidoreductase n=1 Tax=Paraburkholderia strydomiana TaxID=1245417 RepID=UPI0028672975|nr:NAD(P)-dependent oxidoreductase [Paraburkholderia strydomiana]MDR7009646.1 3-hydroxyisobutyrate dehydrogenase [Paraburkholderia strydomiana]